MVSKLLFIINNFASECLYLEEKINQPFCLENASKLMHELLYDTFNKKIYQIFLLKMSYKNLSVKFEAFSRQNGWFIFPQNGGAEKLKF